MAVGSDDRTISTISSLESPDAIGECVAFSGSIADYVMLPTQYIGECIGQAQGYVAKSSSSSVICECIAAPVHSNQKSSSSSVICECIGRDEQFDHCGIDIYDESILVKKDATFINTIGVDIQTIANGEGVNVYVPSLSYASHFNTNDGDTDALITDITTTIRNISSPTSEGTPFYSGGLAGSTGATTNVSPLIWSAPEEASFYNNSSTTFNISIVDTSGTIYDFDSAVITNDGLYSIGANASITVSGWVVDSDKYKANVSISVDILAILPNGGAFDITITHNNLPDGSYAYTQ